MCMMGTKMVKPYVKRNLCYVCEITTVSKRFHQKTSLSEDFEGIHHVLCDDNRVGVKSALDEIAFKWNYC